MTRTLNPILSAALLIVGLLFGQAVCADPPGGRLPPDERERLRHELRQQRHWERQDARQREERQWAPRQGQPAPADGSGDRGAGRGGNPDAWDQERQRMSPEERRQLRMLLRERTGEGRGQPRK